MKDRPNPKNSWNKGNRQRKTNKPQQSQQQCSHNSGKQVCHRCEGQHNASDCSFKQYECHYCKRGHLAKVCRKKEKDSSSPEEAHIVEEEEYSIFHVGSGRVRPLYATSPLQLEEPSVKLQTYTGESIRTCGSTNVQVTHNGQTLSLPLIVTEGKGSGRVRPLYATSPLQLEEPSVELQTYTGESIRTCGSTNVQVTHNGQTLSLPLIVTEGKGPTLLGRNWLEALR